MLQQMLFEARLHSQDHKQLIHLRVLRGYMQSRSTLAASTISSSVGNKVLTFFSRSIPLQIGTLSHDELPDTDAITSNEWNRGVMPSGLMAILSDLSCGYAATKASLTLSAALANAPQLLHLSIVMLQPVPCVCLAGAIGTSSSTISAISALFKFPFVFALFLQPPSVTIARRKTTSSTNLPRCVTRTSAMQSIRQVLP